MKFIAIDSPRNRLQTLNIIAIYKINEELIKNDTPFYWWRNVYKVDFILIIYEDVDSY